MDAEALCLEVFERAWPGWWGQSQRSAALHLRWLLLLSRATTKAYHRQGLQGGHAGGEDEADFDRVEVSQRLRRLPRDGIEVLVLEAVGLPHEEIADALELASSEVDRAVESALDAYDSTGARSRASLAATLRRAAVRPGDIELVDRLRDTLEHGLEQVQESRRIPTAQVVTLGVALLVVVVVLTSNLGGLSSPRTQGGGGTAASGVTLKTKANGGPGQAAARLSLQRVSMFTAVQGWALARSTPGLLQQNAALRTSNGGASWVLSPLPGGAIPRAFTALSADTALAVAMVGDQSNSDRLRRVFRTDDGGATWGSGNIFQLPAEVDPAAATEELTFASPAYGWLVESTKADGVIRSTVMFRTGDGGRVWRQVGVLRTPADPSPTLAPPCIYVGISFVAPDLGWATGDCARVLFDRTVDSGATYQPVALPAPAAAPVPAGTTVKYHLTAPVFAADLYGLMVSARELHPANGAGSTFDTPVLYRSLDAGQTWNFLPLPAVARLSDLDDPTNLWFLGYAPGTTVEVGEALYVSKDGGTHIQPVPSTLPPAPLQLRMVTPSDGFILGSLARGAGADPQLNTTLWVTHNAGATWTDLSPSLPTILPGG